MGDRRGDSAPEVGFFWGEIGQRKLIAESVRATQKRCGKVNKEGFQRFSRRKCPVRKGWMGAFLYICFPVNLTFLSG